jgi:2-methylcitrate dehydratase PrpD
MNGSPSSAWEEEELRKEITYHMAHGTLKSNGFGKPDGQTRLLAKFASRLNFNELPQGVIEQAKTCILDVLGSTFLGSTLPWGEIMMRYVESTGGRPESMVIGSGTKGEAGNAALANGTMAHGFEIDDVLICALHHPGVVIVPAALAMAERENSSGREFIEAVVAGYEVMNRVGKAVGTESHVMRGFFPTSTNGPFGAAAAAGKLLRLTEEQMTDALGIAGSQSGGLFEGIKEGMMTKRLGAGRAAQSGVMAAELAKLGFTGSRTVLEGEWGYLKAFSDKADPALLTEKLGDSYNIMETTFKPYPCCKALHAAIDGMLDLNRQHAFDPEQVTEVVIGGYEKLVRMHDIYEPATSMAAQFSIPYVVSIALLKGNPGVEVFEEKSIRDAKVLEFARKVKLVVDPDVTPYFPANEPSRVTVKLKNGSSYSKTVICSKGTPDNPMSPKELEEKFTCFASRVIPDKQVAKIIGLIRSLNALKSVRELSSLLGKEEASGAG